MSGSAPHVRALGYSQLIVALAAMTGITILGLTGNVSSDAIVGVYGGVIGAALGYANGSRSGYTEGRLSSTQKGETI